MVPSSSCLGCRLAMVTRAGAWTLALADRSLSTTSSAEAPRSSFTLLRSRSWRHSWNFPAHRENWDLSSTVYPIHNRCFGKLGHRLRVGGQAFGLAKRGRERRGAVDACGCVDRGALSANHRRHHAATTIWRLRCPETRDSRVYRRRAWLAGGQWEA